MKRQTYTIARQSDIRPEMTKVLETACELIGDERQGIEVTVSTVSRRSAEASALMWVRLGELAEQTEWEGRKLNDEQWKDLLSAGLDKCLVVSNLDHTGFVCVGLRTSKFSIKKMNEMISLIEAFGSERGVRFSADPRQYSDERRVA